MFFPTDPTSIAKLQNIFHEYERSIQKVRSRHGYLSDKVNQLDAERAELKNSLEEVKDAKSALERNQLELFQLKQEQENRRNSEIMYNTTRDKLRRTEEQHQLDLQDKQQVELTLRNLELEMRTLIIFPFWALEEHSETQRLLTQERSARTLQENLLNGHLRRQQEMEEENKRSMSRSNEVCLGFSYKMHRFFKILEIENAKLEAAAKQQTSKIEALQKEAEEAVKVSPEEQPPPPKEQRLCLRSLICSLHKHQLEEEVLNLRRRMEATQAEHSQVEQLRRDAEERIRQEVQHKLEQVNLFLQTHAASQEALDQIRAANEASLRSQLEQKIRELEAELGRARNSQQDSLTQRDSTRSELERFKQLHSEELRLRKSLSAKLESRLAEANSKLLNERSRSLISSNMANGSLLGPPLDLSSLASPANYGQLNRNASLGLSLLNPAPDGQRSGVDDYLAKVCRGLYFTVCVNAEALLGSFPLNFSL
uniref:Uncharacterized protein n=1 Tax=Oryzias latipes TaxID=8090 RepID=H2L8Z5_ORYLA